MNNFFVVTLCCKMLLVLAYWNMKPQSNLYFLSSPAFAWMRYHFSNKIEWICKTVCNIILLAACHLLRSSNISKQFFKATFSDFIILNHYPFFTYLLQSCDTCVAKARYILANICIYIAIYFAIYWQYHSTRYNMTPCRKLLIRRT